MDHQKSGEEPQEPRQRVGADNRTALDPDMALEAAETFEVVHYKIEAAYHNLAVQCNVQDKEMAQAVEVCRIGMVQVRLSQEVSRDPQDHHSKDTLLNPLTMDFGLLNLEVILDLDKDLRAAIGPETCRHRRATEQRLAIERDTAQLPHEANLDLPKILPGANVVHQRSSGLSRISKVHHHSANRIRRNSSIAHLIKLHQRPETSIVPSL